MERYWLRIALVAILVMILAATLFAIVGMGAAGTQTNYYTWVMGEMSHLMGGFYWQSFAYALWESFMVVGICIGLLALFRQRWNRQGKLAKDLAANVYTVCLIHPLVLVAFAYAFQTITLYPLLKFVISVLIALPLCFLISSLIRKIPFANRIL